MVLVLSSPFFSVQRPRIVELATQHRLPTMFVFKPYVEDRLKCRVEIVRGPFELQRAKLQGQRFRRELGRVELIGRGHIPKDRQSRPLRKSLREQLELLLSQFDLSIEHPRNVAARSRKARYIAALDRIVLDGQDDNRG
jgi:hypothetical protein